MCFYRKFASINLNKRIMEFKKLLLIALMLLVALGASAQFHPSVKVGATVTNFGEQEMKIGVRGGVGIENMFTRHWGIRTGLYYTMKGATSSKDLFCYDSDKTTNLGYLDIPVEAQVLFCFSDITSLSIHAGPYLAYMIHSSLPADAGYKVNRMEVGANVGIDLVVKHFVISPEVQYGLNNAVMPGSLHNVCYALTLGYRF